MLSAFSQDGIKVLDAFQCLDLDDNSRLVIGVLVEGEIFIDGHVSDARDPATGKSGARAVDLCAELGG